jgi:hypothetical protein
MKKPHAINFQEVSITSKKGTRPPKTLQDCPVSFWEKKFFIGPSSNYAVKWTDAAEIEFTGGSDGIYKCFSFEDVKESRVFRCLFPTSPAGDSRAFRSYIKKKYGKRGQTNQHSSSASSPRPRKEPTRFRKPRQNYGKNRRSAPSKRDNWYMFDDDAGDDKDILPSNKSNVSGTVLQKPGEDEPLLQDEESADEAINNSADGTEDAETPQAKLRKRKRLRKSVSAQMDSDTDDEDFAPLVEMTTPGQNHRVVSPADNPLAVDLPEPATKDYKPISDFFQKTVGKKDDKEKAESNKTDDISAPKTPADKGERTTLKKTFVSASNHGKGRIASPPRSQQQPDDWVTPRQGVKDAISPQYSPTRARDPVRDSPPSSGRRAPLTVKKKMYGSRYAWDSFERHSSEDERKNPEFMSSLDESSRPDTSTESAPPFVERAFERNKVLPRSNPYTPNKRAVLSCPDDEAENDGPYNGLSNMGNTCYLNASLQMLYTLKGFIPAIDGKGGGELVKSVVSTAQRVLDISKKPGLLNARPVKLAMDKISDKFRGFQQRDAHEFLGDLIDNIHEELVEGQKKLNADDMKSPTENERDETDQGVPELPIDEYFRCDIEVCLKCNTCGYTRYDIKKECETSLLIP